MPQIRRETTKYLLHILFRGKRICAAGQPSHPDTDRPAPPDSALLTGLTRTTTAGTDTPPLRNTYPIMAYNKKGYYKRAKALQELTAQHYEPERHDRCYKWVWRKFVYPQFGICYHSYLRYLYTPVPAETR